MAVHVNSFLLCSEIKNPTGNIRDFVQAPICSIFPKNGEFPFRCALPGYIQFRRDTNIGDLEFEGQIKCTNEDSINLFEPVKIKGLFKAGEQFFARDFNLKMALPKPGYYEIICILDSAGLTYSFSYGFEVTM